MFVATWMTRDVISVEPKTSVDAAARLMAEKRIRRLPVLASAAYDSPMVGIVSSSDVLHALPRELNPFAPTIEGRSLLKTSDRLSDLLVEDVMTRNPLTISADAPIETAAATMRDRKIGALPVMRGELLVGLITESDIFRAFLQLFDLSDRGARITFDISQQEDILPWLSSATRKHNLRVTSLVALHSLEQPVCVVHVVGAATEPFLEDLWKSHHRVIGVVRAGDILSHARVVDSHQN